MEHVEGRPIAEIRAAARASLSLYDRLGELWDNLLQEEQEKLVALAEEMQRDMFKDEA